MHHYPAEHYRHWRKQHPQTRWRQPAFGENLSTFGLNEHEVCVGDLFRWGEALIEVSQPRSPSYRLARRWNLPELPFEVQEQDRCGWFYRVRRAGMVAADAPLELVQRHYPQLSVASLLDWYFGHPLERTGLRLMMACDALSLRWRKTAAQRLTSGVLEDWTGPPGGPRMPGTGRPASLSRAVPQLPSRPPPDVVLVLWGGFSSRRRLPRRGRRRCHPVVTTRS